MKKTTMIATLVLSTLVGGPVYGKTIHSSLSDLKARLRGEKRSVRSVIPKGGVLQPIRYGRFKAKVVAYNTVKSPDGSVSTTFQDVCLVEGRAPLYDARNLEDYSYSHELVYCDAVVAGKSVRVGVGGLWLLAKFKVFENEPDAAVKAADIAIEAQEGLNTFFMSYSSSFTRQLDLSSAISSVGNSPALLCTSIPDGSGDQICESMEGTTFTATVEVMD